MSHRIAETIFGCYSNYTRLDDVNGSNDDDDAMI